MKMRKNILPEIYVDSQCLFLLDKNINRKYSHKEFTSPNIYSFGNWAKSKIVWMNVWLPYGSGFYAIY